MNCFKILPTLSLSTSINKKKYSSSLSLGTIIVNNWIEIDVFIVVYAKREVWTGSIKRIAVRRIETRGFTELTSIRDRWETVEVGSTTEFILKFIFGFGVCALHKEDEERCMAKLIFCLIDDVT